MEPAGLEVWHSIQGSGREGLRAVTSGLGPFLTAGPQEEELEGAALCSEEGAGVPALLRPFQSEYRALTWYPGEASGFFSPKHPRQLAPHPSLTQHPYHNFRRTVPLLPQPSYS